MNNTKKVILTILAIAVVLGVFWGINSYFQGSDLDKTIYITVIDDITKANPHILLAAMGVPRQEHWLYKYRNHLNVPVAMGVGGTFDVMAGIVDRAPLWMQKSGLEWSYRLIKQPRRIFRMMALPKFVIKILTMKK